MKRVDHLWAKSNSVPGGDFLVWFAIDSFPSCSDYRDTTPIQEHRPTEMMALTGTLPHAAARRTERVAFSAQSRTSCKPVTGASHCEFYHFEPWTTVGVLTASFLKDIQSLEVQRIVTSHSAQVYRPHAVHSIFTSRHVIPSSHS